MKILIAPDSFKGSLAAIEVAKSIESGIIKVDKNTETIILPMADGGEGTLDTLVQATNGRIVEVKVTDPLGRDIMGYYGMMGDNRTAIIEAAAASGLPLLRPSELNPFVASTYGTGQLINHALENGVKSFVICLGGSATNDAGTGILKALGFRFFDREGRELPEGGLALRNLSSIDDTNVSPYVKRARFKIACDVRNPFIGMNGATYVFGPQKGASSEDVEELEHALTVFADVVWKQTGRKIHDLEGAGAAGGVAGGMLAFLNAELKPGVDLVMEALKVYDMIDAGDIDLVITGEGKLDYQTGYGKVIAGLTKLGKLNKTPVIAICGQVEMEELNIEDIGLTSAFSITNGPMSLDEAMKNACILLQHTSEQVFRLFLASGNK